MRVASGYVWWMYSLVIFCNGSRFFCPLCASKMTVVFSTTIFSGSKNDTNRQPICVVSVSPIGDTNATRSTAPSINVRSLALIAGLVPQTTSCPRYWMGTTSGSFAMSGFL